MLQQRIAAVRKVVNVTNLLSLAFLLYFGQALSRLYHVAVPQIPSLVREDGSRKPALESLWVQSTSGGGLDLDLRLSASKTPSDGDVLLHHEEGIQFGWSMSRDLDIIVELEDDSTRNGDNATLRARPVSGIRAVCADDATRNCRDAAAAYVSRIDVIGSRRLVIGEWTTPGARAIGNAMREGSPVYLHAKVAWHEGGGTIPFTTVTATTALVADAAYVRPRATRYLLTEGPEVAAAVADGAGSGVWAPRRAGSCAVCA